MGNKEINAMKEIKLYGLILLLIFPVTKLTAQSNNLSIYSSYVKSEFPMFWIPVYTDSRAKNGVFRDPLWAIKIEEVLCDGKKIDSHRVYRHFSDLDFRTFIPNAKMISYIISPDFSSALRFDVKTNSYDLIEYIIPKKFDEIVIKYRFRYPDLSTSDLYELRSVEYNSFGLDRK